MRKKVLPLLLALALAVLSACGGGSRDGGQAAAPEQVITIAVSGDPTTLDPHKSFNGFVFTVTNQIYETLLFRAADGSLQPRLATEWTPVDETTWEFKLREGVKFSDGSPFNAEAVKFSLERLADPDRTGRAASSARSTPSRSSRAVVAYAEPMIRAITSASSAVVARATRAGRLLRKIIPGSPPTRSPARVG